MADMPTTFANDDASLATEQSAITSRQLVLDTQSADRHMANQRVKDAAWDDLTQTEAQPMPKAPEPSQMPEVPNPKPMGGQEYQQTAAALLGMAMIGGGLSKTHWMGALSALNGALKGVKEGNDRDNKQAFEQYQAKFDAAVKHDEAKHKAYEDVLNDRKLTINEKLEKIKLLGVENHDADMAESAQQRSIDALTRQHDSRAQQLTATKERYQLGQDNISARRQIHAMNQAAAGSGSKLSPEGEQFVEQATASGNMDFIRMVSSRYTGKMAIPIINDLAKSGLDPRTVTADKLMNNANQSAMRLTVSRQQSMDRLTKVVTSLEAKTTDLAAKLNGAGIPPVNATANLIRQKLGDGQLQELHTLMSSVGRLYMEAVTMPASNAQMHATAQEWATGLFNENMSVAQIQGAIRGMNSEIAASRQALDEQVRDMQSSVATTGPTITPGGAPPLAAKPTTSGW